MPSPHSAATIKEKLLLERAKLVASFSDLPAESLERPGLDGGWAIKDVLAHVAMAETVNVKFARRMVVRHAPVQLDELAGEFPDFTGKFELDKFNAWMHERWREKSLEEVLHAFEQARTATLSWLETLSEEQLERTGQHAVWGDQSVRSIFRILVIHDKLHRGDIEKLRAEK